MAEVVICHEGELPNSARAKTEHLSLFDEQRVDDRTRVRTRVARYQSPDSDGPGWFQIEERVECNYVSQKARR